MREEERRLWKAVRHLQAKEKLEIEKTQYMLRNVMDMLEHRERSADEIYRMLDLFRVWTEARDARCTLKRAYELRELIERQLSVIEKIDRARSDVFSGREAALSSLQAVAENGRPAYGSSAFKNEI